MEKAPIVLNDSTHTPLMPGETLPPRVIPVSTNSGNIITRADDGLFVPTPLLRKTATVRTALTYGHPDDITAKNACGRMGTGVYWNGYVAIIMPNDKAALGMQANLECIPCKSDGTPVPYNITLKYVKDEVYNTHGAIYTITFAGIPTHIQELDSRARYKLGRLSSDTGGLDDVYEVVQLPRYITLEVMFWQNE